MGSLFDRSDAGEKLKKKKRVKEVSETEPKSEGAEVRGRLHKDTGRGSR